MKKVICLAAVMVFMFSSYIFADSKPDDELVSQKTILEQLSAQIKSVKEQLAQMYKEYAAQDIKMRQDIVTEKKAISDKEGESAAHKKMVTKSKQMQADLKKAYHDKKKPIAQQLDKLKQDYAKCKVKIKKLEKKIKDISEGKLDTEEYTQKIDGLKEKLAKAKEDLEQSLVKVRSDADQKIADLTGNIREKSRKAILTDLRDKEVELQKQYNKTKAGIKEEIAKVKKEFNEEIRKNREALRIQLVAQKPQPAAKGDKEAKEKKQSSATQNFGPAN